MLILCRMHTAFIENISIKVQAGSFFLYIVFLLCIFLHPLIQRQIYQWGYENTGTTSILFIAQHKSLTWRWTTCCFSFLLQKQAVITEIQAFCASKIIYSLSSSHQKKKKRSGPFTFSLIQPSTCWGAFAPIKLFKKDLWCEVYSDTYMM